MPPMNRFVDVDNFAGGGGASLGIEQALGKPIDVAINHDAEALAMHRANHPDTVHYHHDIWQVDPADVVLRHGLIRLAWFSPDCTFHSKAKGSAPIREAGKRSRDLSWVVVRWARAAQPQIIILENVEEFAQWGPLGEDHRPCLERKGDTFRRWVGSLEGAGYTVEWRELRACDYGAPTIRKRLFLVARRDGLPIVWPEPTHGPGRMPYRTAAECIDWDIPVHSIFLSKEEGRKVGVRRPLVEATMRRIARGVYKYVIGVKKPFIAPLAYGGKRVHSLDDPLRTTTCRRNFHLVSAFLAQHNTGMTGRPTQAPLSTIVGRGTQKNLVTAHLTAHFSSHTAGGQGDIQRPLKTVLAHGTHHSLVQAFLVKYYGEGGQWGAVDAPAPTVTTKARLGLVTVEGVDYEIVDIGMRMLTPRELFRAQGFPDSYEIAPAFGSKPLTKAAQIRMCGNSVCPPIARSLVAANVVDAYAQAA